MLVRVRFLSYCSLLLLQLLPSLTVSVVFRYLQEVGYTDTILDVRTQRVRSLLGLSGSEQNGSVENKNLQHLINGTERRKDSKR